MTFRPARSLLLAAIAAALVGAAVQPASAEPAVPSATIGGAHHYPGMINGHAENLFPEGVAWDAARQRFLISSLRDGTVSVVRPDGTPTVLVDDPQVLVSTIGLHVDSARGRVLVANSDTGLARRSDPDTAQKLAGLGAYDLRTGERLFYVDLAALAGDAGAHFANDVTFDTDGTAYVTDSFAPIIYRVAVDGSASVFVRDSRLAGPVGGFGLNGIVRQARTLVVGKYDDGTMWRVPIGHAGADPGRRPA